MWSKLDIYLKKKYHGKLYNISSPLLGFIWLLRFFISISCMNLCFSRPWWRAQLLLSKMQPENAYTDWKASYGNLFIPCLWTISMLLAILPLFVNHEMWILAFLILLPSSNILPCSHRSSTLVSLKRPITIVTYLWAYSAESACRLLRNFSREERHAGGDTADFLLSR